LVGTAEASGFLKPKKETKGKKNVDGRTRRGGFEVTRSGYECPWYDVGRGKARGRGGGGHMAR